MSHRDHHANLVEVIAQLKSAADHLSLSWRRCQQLSTATQKQQEEAQIELEALTGRFARLVDMLIQKVYRSIDAVEFVGGGTLIDALNRADKRGLIDSLHEMRLLKDLRNDIAHEYIIARLNLLHEEVLAYTPKLLELVDRAVHYSQSLPKE
jgi:hypothetical protein